MKNSKKEVRRLTNLFKIFLRFDLPLIYFDYSLAELEKSLFARNISHEVLLADKY